MPVESDRRTPVGSIMPAEEIARTIRLLRGHKVMLDADLAELYGVETRALVQAVRRNLDRFPDDFAFKLTRDEFRDLRSQSVTSSWGGRRSLPHAFTEQGVAMLSSVLRSKRAVRANIEIMRAFVPPSGPFAHSVNANGEWHDSRDQLNAFAGLTGLLAGSSGTTGLQGTDRYYCGYDERSVTSTLLAAHADGHSPPLQFISGSAARGSRAVAAGKRTVRVLPSCQDNSLLRTTVAGRD